MAFPTTPVLDTFSATLANWTNPIFGGTAVVISAGQLAGTAGADNAACWTSAFSSSDQEIYFDVPTDTNNLLSLYFLIQSPGITCYSMDIVGDGSLRMRRFNNSVLTTLKTSSLSIASGDSVGASKVGSLISVWTKPAAGAWTLVDSVTDSAPLIGPGQIGLDIEGTALRVDNFGGDRKSVV